MGKAPEPVSVRNRTGKVPEYLNTWPPIKVSLPNKSIDMRIPLISIVLCAMCLAMLTQCSRGETHKIVVEQVNLDQDFKVEAPQGTVKAILQLKGETSTPFQLIVSDGIFTSTFMIQVGTVDQEHTFDWYDSPLLLHYVPDPAATGNIVISCKFETAE